MKCPTNLMSVQHDPGKRSGQPSHSRNARVRGGMVDEMHAGAPVDWVADQSRPVYNHIRPAFGRIPNPNNEVPTKRFEGR